jgi:hypothetical protein
MQGCPTPPSRSGLVIAILVSSKFSFQITRTPIDAPVWVRSCHDSQAAIETIFRVLPPTCQQGDTIASIGGMCRDCRTSRLSGRTGVRRTLLAKGSRAHPVLVARPSSNPALRCAVIASGYGSQSGPDPMPTRPRILSILREIPITTGFAGALAESGCCQFAPGTVCNAPAFVWAIASEGRLAQNSS